MARLHLILFISALCASLPRLYASAGDADPIYKSCVEQCEKSGCVGSKCFQHCKFSSDGKPIDGPWYMQEPLYLRWKQWDCRSDCRYECMLAREEERENFGDKPVKYHGKWPFKRVYGIQEPVAVALSALNLAMQFHGLNMKVCTGMGIAQLLVWAVWAGVTRHPSRWKLWVVVVGGGLAMLFEIYDFPPYRGFVDAHALWHATTIPFTYLWWSFVKDDAEFRTLTLMKKVK